MLNKPPFLEIPHNYDPNTYLLLNRMVIYIKTLESKLMQNGILTLGEVEKGAKQSEALQGIEAVEAVLTQQAENIERIDDPQAKQEYRVKWECGPEKLALEDALNNYKQQLADSFGD